MMHKKTSLLAIENPLERVALRALLALLAILMCAYLYFVGASVLNVIARKDADRQTTGLQNTISAMEQQYFALSQTVNPAMASAIGLTPIGKTDYVYRPGNAAAVTIQSNEI